MDAENAEPANQAAPSPNNADTHAMIEDMVTKMGAQETAAIEPIYSQSEISGSIHFGRFKAEIEADGAKRTGEVDVSLRFIPNGRLVLVGMDGETRTPSAALASLFLIQDAFELSLVDREVKFNVLSTGKGQFLPQISVVTASKPCKNIRRTVFHLFNLPDFFSSTDYTFVQRGITGTALTRCGQLKLRADGWQITIAAKPTIREDVKALKDQGGWFITHVGEIVREDGSDYSTDQLEDVLRCLHHCISFALGRWTGLALPVGMNANGERVFEQWGLPLATSGAWHGSASWFDDLHGDSLAEMFPGFWKLWHSKLWAKVLGQIIYWYLGACERGVGIGVDAGLILAQTALELFAWNYCVLDRAMISAEAFRPGGLSAADKFRLAASALGLPLGISPQLSALNSRPGEKWKDAMDAISGVRNSIVHPVADRKLPEYSDYEALKLSLWYLDLMILRLCDYRGKYGNRLNQPRFAGSVEAVPWA